MDAATAGLIGAVVGGTVTLVTSAVNAHSARRLEAAKAEWTRANVIETELRAQVAAVARELLAGQHSMEWLCALTDSGGVLTQKDVETYHSEIHATYPKLLGGLAALSSLNDHAYKELMNLADGVFEVDNAITEALRGFPASALASSQEVAKQRSAATRLYQTLPKSIARIMKDLRQ